MSRNVFEAQGDDPQEELPLFEHDQRELADKEVDELVQSMDPSDIEAAVKVQFGTLDTSHQKAHIARLKQEGLYATARFFERALQKRTT